MENKNPMTGNAIQTGASSDQPPMLQVFVFRGDEYLGWDCFSSEQISVGSGSDVDLQLNDRAIADVHAFLRVEKGSVSVTYYMSENSQPNRHDASERMIISPLDSIVIGPFTLKIKLNRSGKRLHELSASPDSISPDHSTNDKDLGHTHEDVPSTSGRVDAESPGLATEGGSDAEANIPDKVADNYNLTFEGKIKNDISLDEVKGNLERLLKKDRVSIERLFSGRKVILKRNASLRAVQELQALFGNLGVLCAIEPVYSSQKDSKHETCNPDDTGRMVMAPEDTGKEKAPESPPQAIVKRIPDADDEEDDEEDARATFSLKDKIRNSYAIPSQGTSRGKKNEILLEVVKTRADSIVDVRFIGAGDKYFIRTDQEQICLAENRGSGEILLYLNEQLRADVKPIHAGVRQGAQVCGAENRDDSCQVSCQHRLPANETAIIQMGPYEFLLRQAAPSESPKVKETASSDREYVRHFGRSVVFHVILLIILGMMPTYKPESLPTDDGRFVRVDSKQLEEIRKRIQPPQLPKKAPEILKIKEQQVARRIEKKTEKATELNRPVEAQPVSQKVASAQGSGTGSGQGEAPTKNVHQTGILSMLGDNIGIKPQEAMAAVTNLDAVSSSAENKAQFKVGGIVGKLDGGRIEIPKAGIVNTKGSSQVMQGGAGGKEVRVAALDKGNTGKNQVKAKVTAQLNKTVKVQGGGMSREEVKRIIDQHLDEITRCYETALVANPSLMGRVVFEWKILMSGKVGEVSIKSSTINSSDIHACIQSSIKSWEFPQPDGSEVIVSYPFIFDIVGF